MQIPIWCLILAIIVLFIVLLLSAKIKLVISYANEASVYVKFLFFKINLVPSAPKPKKKKTKKLPLHKNGRDGEKWCYGSRSGRPDRDIRQNQT